MEAFLEQLLRFSWLGYLVIGVMAFLEAAVFVGLVAPGETVVILGGFLAGQRYLSPIGVAVAASVGAALGDSVGYELGRRLGRGWLERYTRRRAFRRRQLERARRFFEQYGGAAIFIGRFVGFLRAFAPFLAGVAGMPYGRFVLWNVSGGVLWATGCTLLGYYAGANWQRIAHAVGWAGLAVGTTALVVALLVHRWRRASRAAAPPAHMIDAGRRDDAYR